MTPAPAPPADDVAGPGTARILVVDDQEDNVSLLSDLLACHGYEVQTARSGEEALEAVDRAAPDLVLLDVVMPGMDGPSWVREALKARPDTRVIFVSGYAEDALSDHQARIPNSVFLPKPFSLQQLTTTVQSQLH